MDELALIDRLRLLATDPAARGLDDDVAVIGDLVLTHDMIAEGVHYLESDPPARFTRLLDAALGRDAHLSYERARRYYACEVTEQGLVAISHDKADAVALPLGAAP